MTKVEFRQATEADCIAFYGARPMMSMRGYVAVMDGEVVGIGGAYREDKSWIAFSEMRQPLRENKKYIAIAIRLLMAFFHGFKVPVFAVANKDEPTAGPLLEKLGFERTGLIGPEGEVLLLKRDK